MIKLEPFVKTTELLHKTSDSRLAKHMLVSVSVARVCLFCAITDGQVPKTVTFNKDLIIHRFVKTLMAGADAQVDSGKTDGSVEKPKCKPCCACPETRKARDLCIVERGEEECTELIQAHRECMRKMGFNI